MAPFKSIEEAREFLECNLEISDDCAANIERMIILPVDGDTCTKECVFQVRAFDLRCVDEMEPGESETIETFTLAVDRDGPTITCGFFTPQDPHHVSPLFDPCLGLPPPPPLRDDFLHIDQNCFDGDFVDVNFWYRIEVRQERELR